MTVGEIYSVIWAKTRHHQPENDVRAEMYADLQEVLGRA